MTPSDKAVLDPIARCPFCGISYDEERLRTLKKERQRDVIHATCTGCRRAMLFTVKRNEGNIACVGLFTDCDATDALKFMTAKRLTLDDVLLAHITLSTMTKASKRGSVVDKTARIG
ncbi:MAG: hypothetical protein AAB839_02750 [Patescibacteria group bacterium]|mgnify:FL=1